MDQKPPPEYKVVVIGESGVGKTCIINRYYFGSFNDSNAPTVGTAYVKCRVENNGKVMFLNLWDTAGQEKYSNLVPLYVRDSNAIIICFDLTNPDSLESVRKYRNTLSETVPNEVPILICGNKLDLCSDQQAGREVHEWAISQNIPSFSVSAKSGQGIEDLFQEVATLVHNTGFQVNKINLQLQKQREREENPSSCNC